MLLPSDQASRPIGRSVQPSYQAPILERPWLAPSAPWSKRMHRSSTRSALESKRSRLSLLLAVCIEVQAVLPQGMRQVLAYGDREQPVPERELVCGDRELQDPVPELECGDRERPGQLRQLPNGREQSAIGCHGAPSDLRCNCDPHEREPSGHVSTSIGYYATHGCPGPKGIHSEQQGFRTEVPVVVDQPHMRGEPERVQRNSVPPIQRRGQARRLQTCCANSIS